MKLAGHCVRHKEEIASQVVLWTSNEGKRKSGRPSTTFIDTMLDDSGMNSTQEIQTVMMDRKLWKDIIHGSLARSKDRPR